MAGRIIFTSPLATQSDIQKFYKSKTLKRHANEREHHPLFRAKIAGYLRSLQASVSQGL